MSEESQLGPSYDATVMLDIGDGYGALMIHTGPDLHLAEIEVSRVDGGPVPGGHTHEHDHGAPHGHEHGHPDEHEHQHAPRTHVAVRERRGPAGVRYAAIYPELPAGDYEIWGADGSVTQTVTILDGEITELDWQ